MKIIVILLLLTAPALLCVAAQYPFPPFNVANLAFGKEALEKNLEEENYPAKSLSELRAIMTFGDSSQQDLAAKLLVQAGDQETILRVIYSLKQGHWMAEEILKTFPSRRVIQYLMEDVAHGSTEDFSEGLTQVSYGNARLAATEIVANILGEVEDFPEETMQWLRYVRFGDATVRSDNLSEKSKFLVEWWIVNKKAFLAEKWDQIIPVPNAGSYSVPKPVVLRDDELYGVPVPEFKPPQPWEFKPLEVSESFEEWSARIVHPERRDLSWVELTLVDGEWIPHPPKRLDPLAAPISPSRTIKRPVVGGKSPMATHQSPIWIAFFILVLGLLFWLWSKRSKPA